MVSVSYFGLDKDAWDLIFGALNALVIILGLPFALRTLRQSVRQQLNSSLTKLLEEYRSASFRDSVRHTISKFPVFDGNVEVKVRKFLEYGSKNLEKADLEQARAVIHKLNDLGAYIDRRGVREEDFYGHTYPRLLELKARLEPLILSVSAARSFRWGMRIRRMGMGAYAYYKSSKLHSVRAFVIDGVTLIEQGRTPWYARGWQRVKKLLGFHSYTPRAVRMVKADEEDLRVCGCVLTSFTEEDLAFLSYAV
jgi:hypothetical protein